MKIGYPRANSDMDNVRVELLRIEAQYHIGRLTAWLVFPVLKGTGWRFSKSWRGCWWLDHVAANLRADGITPGVVRFGSIKDR